ncbi:MAG: UDP-N-acetylmuramoyl-L-alanyl-D-glutamate--2,6-diaminopimelate ligase [Phycisphaerae bacterium]
MRFSALLSAAGLEAPSGSADPQIGRVCIDSRQVRSGDCFVAMVGSSVDGHDYIGQAVSAGAAAVVAEKDVGGLDKTPLAIVPNGRIAAGLLAQAIRGNPAGKLTCIGVTGTNGKTTVAHMARAILTAAGKRVGLIGTIAYDTGLRRGASGATTPDPVELARMTDEMVRAGRDHLVMEVSSHALDQDRTAGLAFAAAAFTNRTGDHLDYHGSMENYRRAKSKLFAQLPPPARAVINLDDAAGGHMADVARCRVVGYSLQQPSEAEITADIRQATASGSRFFLQVHGRSVEVDMPLIGVHNVRNALAAAGLCDAVGVELSTIARALREMPFVPGRLQRVGPGRPVSVFVDYAHTDDALANVCSALRPLTPGRLVVVFGCGGDRDRSKRPRMAKVAQDLADVVVVTTDNPRSERPGEIIQEILEGFDHQQLDRVYVEADRGLAIDWAIGEALDGDVVLIAGKGHETYQIIGSERLDFDDAAVAAEALQRRSQADGPKQ